MNNGILLLAFYLCFAFHMQAQDENPHKVAHSTLTSQYMAETTADKVQLNNPKYVYSEIAEKRYVNAFIKVEETLDPTVLSHFGVVVGTKAGDIWTIKIPADSVDELTQVESGIVALQLDQPIYANLDKAREKTNVDMVHEGTALAQAFTGQGVVVGILDVGFDYTHPTFYDSEGEVNRIKKIWAQKSTGTPPAGYNYGHEISDPMEMLTVQTDNPDQSHGSHVAGIAAGSGYGGAGDSYKGVAYESELVFVGITPPQEQWTNTGMTDIVDGINYIYEYAVSQGKPAVANLSWGCSVGPHDGTSLFSQAVDNLTGEGKIFTISAGNNGGNLIHLNKAFSATDTVMHSFVDFDDNLAEKKTWVDIWGEVGDSFCVELETYNNTTPVSTTGTLCIDDSTVETFLVGSDSDTFFIKMTTLAEDINGKPHAFLDIHSQTRDNISVKVKAASGTVNAWMGYVLESTGYYGTFIPNNIPGAVYGNDKMTIGEMACTQSAITVGAYASKNSFTNISGGSFSYSNYVSTNKICPFSSRGPTSDGRTKPDITAPGMTLASAVNSADLGYAPGGSRYGNTVYKYADAATARDYYFAESSGTSMSAPMVAGIVALVLEADPTATPEELQSLMAGTAIKDSYTSQNPNPDIWGAGKIDALAMMQFYFPSSVEEHDFTDLIFYPNPTDDVLNVSILGEKKVVVTNSVGETVLRSDDTHSSLSLKQLEPGMYFVSVFSVDDKLLARQAVVKI